MEPLPPTAPLQLTCCPYAGPVVALLRTTTRTKAAPGLAPSSWQTSSCRHPAACTDPATCTHPARLNRSRCAAGDCIEAAARRDVTCMPATRPPICCRPASRPLYIHCYGPQPICGHALLASSCSTGTRPLAIGRAVAAHWLLAADFAPARGQHVTSCL
jgi:hypothetical protein